MERLTKKHDGSGSYTQFGDKYIPNHNIRHKQCVEKLGKLEDIEEELGIPLEVLFKAVKGIIYFDDGTYSNDFHIENNGLSTCFFCNYDFKNTTKDVVHLKDYGKTWALTKEELE